MATEVQYAGEYELDHVTLTTSSGAIIPIVPLEINLFEGIFDHGMSGSIIISDTENVVDLAPIIGQDYISFKIKTPTLEDEKNQTIDFLKKASKECPVTRNLSQEIDIKISWHNNKSQT